MRAPSRARPKAIPLPMPRLPPVINAVRPRSDMSSQVLKKRRQYNEIAAEALAAPPQSGCFEGLSSGSAHAGDYDGDVVGLLRGAGPLLGGRNEIFSQALRWCRTLAQDFLPQTLHTKFFAVNVLRFGQTVAESDEHASGRDLQRALRIGDVLEHPDDGAALIELLDSAVADKERRKMSGIRIRKRVGVTIIERIEKRSLPIV